MSPVLSAVQLSEGHERRLSVERRLGERRLRLVNVSLERRDSPERRQSFDRRETASGHLRNALQILTDLVDGHVGTGDASASLRAAAGRLWQCLREVERLEAARSYLGRRLRVHEASRRGP